MTAAAPAPSWLTTVADEVGRFDRSSTAERVADLLRRRITEGDLAPGSRLSEEQLVQVLKVSRNTLREAFRFLAHEGLLVHVLHRGVFVTELDEAGVVDLYCVRRMIECNVVRALPALRPKDLQPLRDDVAAAQAAAKRGEWRAVGTANMAFHAHLVALAGSRRADEVTARLLAELRLAFGVVSDPKVLHEKYIARNKAVLSLLRAGKLEQAADELAAYLRDSEQELLNAIRGRDAEADAAAPFTPSTKGAP